MRLFHHILVVDIFLENFTVNSDLPTTPTLTMAPFDHGKTLGQPSYTTGTSFLTLPGELRNRIYEKVIKGLGIDSSAITWILPCCRLISERPSSVVMRRIVSSCRMGQVSRTVRKEFLSMLWRRFVFNSCDCMHRNCLEAAPNESEDVQRNCLEAEPNEIGDLWSFAPMLRGHVTNLVFFIHSQESLSKFSILANILLAVEFKGRLYISGNRNHVIAFAEGFELIKSKSNGTIELIESIDEQIDRREWINRYVVFRGLTSFVLVTWEPSRLFRRFITFDATKSWGFGSQLPVRDG